MPTPARSDRPGAGRRTTPVAAASVGTAMVLTDAPRAAAVPADGRILHGWEIQSCHGTGDNITHPGWGRAGTACPREGAASSVDERSEVRAGPDARYVSNRMYGMTADRARRKHPAVGGPPPAVVMSRRHGRGRPMTPRPRRDSRS